MINEIEIIAARIFERRQQFEIDSQTSWEALIEGSAQGDASQASILNAYLNLASRLISGHYLCTSVNDLEMLPVGTVVVDAEGWWTAQSDYCAAALPNTPRAIEWSSDAHWWKSEEIALPARVIFVPLGVS